jgi:hypothetical protein
MATPSNVPSLRSLAMSAIRVEPRGIVGHSQRLRRERAWLVSSGRLLRMPGNWNAHNARPRYVFITRSKVPYIYQLKARHTSRLVTLTPRPCTSSDRQVVRAAPRYGTRARRAVYGVGDERRRYSYCDICNPAVTKPYLVPMPYLGHANLVPILAGPPELRWGNLKGCWRESMATCDMGT